MDLLTIILLLRAIGNKKVQTQRSPVCKQNDDIFIYYVKRKKLKRSCLEPTGKLFFTKLYPKATFFFNSLMALMLSIQPFMSNIGTYYFYVYLYGKKKRLRPAMAYC